MEELRIIKNDRLHKLVNTYVGKVFGKLVVASILGTKNNRTFVKAICRCGNFKGVFLYHILRGHTKSCGCINGNTYGNLKHGEARRGKDTCEYRAWLRMKSTALSSSEKIRSKYKHLDTNGIKICERWLDKFLGYKNFLEDIGRRPDLRYKFFRLDKTKGFNKENCAWVMKNKNIEIEKVV